MGKYNNSDKTMLPVSWLHLAQDFLLSQYTRRDPDLSRASIDLQGKRMSISKHPVVLEGIVTLRYSKGDLLNQFS